MKSKALSFMRLLILKSFPLVFFLLLAGKAQSQPIAEFITSWQTDSEQKITIPTEGSGYDFTINWGDGTVNETITGTPGDITHTYTSADVYTVTITPTTLTGFPRIYLNNFGNSQYLQTISQWGEGKWSSMNNAFSGATNLQITTSDLPNLSLATDLSFMFYNASSINSDLSGWIVTSVTDMSGMFYGARSFNSDLSNWNVSNVTDMSNMFNGALSFNGDLSIWDVSSVTNTNSMFMDATAFNSDLSNWVLGNDSNMSYMFSGAQNFNGNLSSWNVSNVFTMSYMFFNARSFNSNITNWNVSSVTDMNSMFKNASSFNSELSNWNMSYVTNLSNMFDGASSFNRDISNWNLSGITDMSNMFNGATSFNSDLGDWNVSNVSNMSNLFNGATSFNADLGSWNVSNVIDMSNMFNGASSFNRDLNNWNVSGITNMSNMFNGAVSFNADLGGWNISNVIDASDFLTSGKLSPVNYDALLLGWAELSSSETQIPARLNINFGGSKYSNEPSVITARAYLTDTKNWTISDGGIYTPPLISSTLLALNNSTIQVTFSERVYSDITGTSDLEASDFSLAIAGGSAALSSATPISLSTTDHISFILGIGLTGKPDGTETLTLSPVTNSIYNLAGDVANITQSNNTTLLYESLLTNNGKIGTTNSTYVDKNGKTGSSTGLNASGKSIVMHSND